MADLTASHIHGAVAVKIDRSVSPVRRTIHTGIAADRSAIHIESSVIDANSHTIGITAGGILNFAATHGKDGTRIDLEDTVIAADMVAVNHRAVFHLDFNTGAGRIHCQTTARDIRAMRDLRTIQRHLGIGSSQDNSLTHAVMILNRHIVQIHLSIAGLISTFHGDHCGCRHRLARLRREILRRIRLRYRCHVIQVSLIR